MYSVDKTGYKEVLLNFHQQISAARDIYTGSKIQLDTSRINNILYFGMGGSGIVGDLLTDVLFDDLKVPMRIVRGYLAPAWCDEHTLIIVCSYSGNTEETLSAIKAAEKSGAQIVAITSGGQLANWAGEKKWHLITVPGNLMPRQALGYLFFPLYHLLGENKLLITYQENLDKFIKFIFDLNKKNDYLNAEGRVLSMELAKTVQGKIPVIYSTAPYLSTISRRWKNQIQENGKSLAFSNLLPEMNHNEIVGWELDVKGVNELLVIFLENEIPHPRINKRIALSKQIIKDRGVEVVDIYSCGTTVMEKVFSLLVMGDWMSYYLALLYKKDPATIRNIDFLKEEMAKEKA